MSDLVKRLIDASESTHLRGCAGRNCECTCGHDATVDVLLTEAADVLAKVREALEPVEQMYQKMMQPPPDWTNFTGEDDPRLVFAREAWFGAAKIVRKAIALLEAMK